MDRDETPPGRKVQRESVLGDRLGVAAGAGHDLDVGLPAVGKVDMIRPHRVADDAFSFSITPSVVQVLFGSQIHLPSMEIKPGTKGQYLTSTAPASASQP